MAYKISRNTYEWMIFPPRFSFFTKTSNSDSRHYALYLHKLPIKKKYL